MLLPLLNKKERKLQVGVGEGIAILQVWLYGCGIGLIN
jgi:hypothetical protein